MEEKIKQIQQHGYAFELGDYMSGGWQLFKKNAGSYIGYFWLSGVIMFFSAILLAIPFIGFLFWMQMILLLFSGYFTFSRSALRGKPDFGAFFAGFKRIGQLTLLFLMFALISALLYVPVILITPEEYTITTYSNEFMNYNFNWNAAPGYETEFLLINLVLNVLMLLIFTFFIFAIPLVVDQKFSAWEAMMGSLKIVSKKYFGFVGLQLILFFIYMGGGIITCMLGLMVIIPWIFSITFYAYDKILDPDQEKDPEEDLDVFGVPSKDINTEKDELPPDILMQ